MPFPNYVQTRQVTAGGAMVLESSQLLRVKIEIASTKSLVWAASGFRFERLGNANTSEVGAEATVTVPVTDQQGWKDSEANTVIDVTAPDSYTHLYTALVTFLDQDGNAAGIRPVQYAPFALPAGDTPVDLDLLVPSTTVPGAQVSIPDSWSMKVAAAEQAAADAAAQLAKRGQANGVAALDSGARVPEGQLPDRLSETNLNSTIGALAANTRPRGARSVIIGDSITAYNGGTSTATPVQTLGGYDGKGIMRWAAVMLRQRIDIVGNSGIGSQRANQIRARFQTDAIALKPDIVFLLAGTNDQPTDDTAGDLTAMYDAAAAAGAFVVAFTIPPSATASTAIQNHRLSINAWLREYVRGRGGMALVDLAAVWQDTSASGFIVKSGYTHDGVHPSVRGAQMGGMEVARVLDPLLPASPVGAAPDASAPGQLFRNGRFAGSGSATPDGWTVAGGSPTFSYVPRGDGRPGQLLAVSVPVGSFVTLTQNVDLGVLLRTGDDYDFTLTAYPSDLEKFGASTQRMNIVTQNYNGSAFSERRDAVFADDTASYGNTRFPAASGVFRTQRGTLTAGKTLMQVVISFRGGGTYLLSDAIVRNLTMLEAGIESPENVPHSNLLSNGTFETNITGWTGGGGASVARNTAEKHSGAASLEVTNAANSNSDARFDSVNIDRTKPINFSVWVKAPAGHAGRLHFNWMAAGASYISTTQTASFTGTGGWQQLLGTVPASVIPATTAALLFAVARSGSTGTPVVYVDDVDVWQ